MAQQMFSNILNSNIKRLGIKSSECNNLLIVLYLPQKSFSWISYAILNLYENIGSPSITWQFAWAYDNVPYLLFSIFYYYCGCSIVFVLIVPSIFFTCLLLTWKACRVRLFWYYFITINAYNSEHIESFRWIYLVCLLELKKLEALGGHLKFMKTLK